MKPARFICSEDLFASPNSGCIDSFTVRLTLRANACASMHYVVATRMTNRFSANCLIIVLTNPSKANHDCSTNAETLSCRRQKSVQRTLRLALLLITLIVLLDVSEILTVIQTPFICGM